MLTIQEASYIDDR